LTFESIIANFIHPHLQFWSFKTCLFDHNFIILRPLKWV
jgi:hypothetical protein